MTIYDLMGFELGSMLIVLERSLRSLKLLIYTRPDTSSWQHRDVQIRDKEKPMEIFFSISAQLLQEFSSLLSLYWKLLKIYLKAKNRAYVVYN